VRKQVAEMGLTGCSSVGWEICGVGSYGQETRIVLVKWSEAVKESSAARKRLRAEPTERE